MRQIKGKSGCRGGCAREERHWQTLVLGAGDGRWAPSCDRTLTWQVMLAPARTGRLAVDGLTSSCEISGRRGESTKSLESANTRARCTASSMGPAHHKSGGSGSLREAVIDVGSLRQASILIRGNIQNRFLYMPPCQKGAFFFNLLLPLVCAPRLLLHLQLLHGDGGLPELRVISIIHSKDTPPRHTDTDDTPTYNPDNRQPIHQTSSRSPSLPSPAGRMCWSSARAAVASSPGEARKKHSGHPASTSDTSHSTPPPPAD